MTTHEKVNQRYAEIQTLLRDNFGAEGRGVGEMVRSIESNLPTTLAWEIRAIAHIRNKVVHEGLTQIPRYFEPLCVEAVSTMKKLKPKKSAQPKQPMANKLPTVPAATQFRPATPSLLIPPSLFANFTAAKPDVVETPQKKSKVAKKATASAPKKRATTAAKSAVPAPKSKAVKKAKTRKAG